MSFAAASMLPRWLLPAYIGSAALYVASLYYAPYTGDVLLKVAPILLLLSLAVTGLRGRTRVLMSLALLFSGCGDALLARNLFAPGLGSFLVAQLCYVGHFLEQRQYDVRARSRVLLVFVVCGLVCSLILPNTGEMLVPVTLYMVALAMMGVTAALYGAASHLIFYGALSFILSDSMIAIDRFNTPFEGAQYLIMVTYYAAQLMILWGVMGAAEAPDNQTQ